MANAVLLDRGVAVPIVLRQRCNHHGHNSEDVQHHKESC